MDVTLRGWPVGWPGPTVVRRPTAVALGVFIIFGALIRLIALDRFPPGLHFDEAVYGLLARDILNGARPVFFSAWTGREPLYMYLMAPIQAIVSVNTLAIRLTSALIGLATLPLTYLLGRELFNRRVALLATGLIAVNYWHLTISRNGYPNILIPPLEALSFYFLWRAYHSEVRVNPGTDAGNPGPTSHPLSESANPLHHWPSASSRARRGADRPSANPRRRRPSAYPLLSAAAGGLFAGLVLYTYLAARFYPITLTAIGVYALLVDRDRFKRRLPTIAIAITTTLIVVAPLAAHFIRNPNDFVERADQVLILTQASSASEGVRLFAGNVWQTALGFFVRGDPRWHYNLPGKPIFDPLIAVFFLAGLAIALHRRRELPYAAVLIWTAVMCLPGILTADLQPASQRMFGTFPALVMLPALGLDAAWRWTEENRPQLARLAVAGMVLLFAWEGFTTSRTYFGDWVRRYETYEIFNGDYAQMADLARREMAAGHTVVLVSEHYKHPTLAYLAPETMDEAVWTLGKRGLVYPARGTEEIVYLVPRHPFPSGSRVDRSLRERAHTVETVNHPTGRPAFAVYRVRPAPLPTPSARLSFNGEARFVAADWPAAIPRDTAIPITVHWQVLQSVPQARTFAIRLLDDQGLGWAQTDEMSYLSEQWHPGDLVEQWFTLAVDPTTPAGTYTLQLTLTDEAAHPLPVLREDGRPVGVWLELGEIELAKAGGRIEEPGPGRAMGASLRVLDHSSVEGGATPGARLTPSVLWQKTAAVATDLPVRIELVDGNDEVWFAAAQPLAGGYALSAWQVGEVVRGKYSIPLPADAPAGPSTVRLRVGDAVLTLGEIDVQAEGRLFAPPAIETPLRARFGNAIQFLGYDLPKTSFTPGERVPLTLYWQALAPVAGDFKVFIHLLDPAGQLRGQKDDVPASGTRPTAGWVEGEVIIDTSEVQLPPDAPAGTYQIEIGLYDAVTIARLPAFDAGGSPLPDNRLLLSHAIQVER